MVVGTNCARTTLLASRNNNLNLTHINRPKGSLGVAYPCWTGRSSSLRRRVVLAKVAQPLSDTTVVAESQPTADEALQQQLEQLHVLASIDDVPVVSTSYVAEPARLPSLCFDKTHANAAANIMQVLGISTGACDVLELGGHALSENPALRNSCIPQRRGV